MSDKDFSIKICHGWYSETAQQNKLSFKHEDSNKCNYIFWLDINDEPVLVTHVTNDPNNKPCFDDVVYLGPLKRWYINKQSRL